MANKVRGTVKMFGTKVDDQKLVNDMGVLVQRMTDLAEKMEGQFGTATTVQEYEKAKKELVDLQIKMDREKETWAREKRETEHMVGLQRQRADQEQELATREAKLTVKEENADTREKLFEEKMEELSAAMKDQIGYLRTDIIEGLLSRMPNFDGKITLGPAALIGNGNGDHDG